MTGGGPRPPAPRARPVCRMASSHADCQGAPKVLSPQPSVASQSGARRLLSWPPPRRGTCSLLFFFCPSSFSLSPCLFPRHRHAQRLLGPASSTSPGNRLGRAWAAIAVDAVAITVDQEIGLLSPSSSFPCQPCPEVVSPLLPPSPLPSVRPALHLRHLCDPVRPLISFAHTLPRLTPGLSAPFGTHT
jgi:hypothetical protein